MTICGGPIVIFDGIKARTFKKPAIMPHDSTDWVSSKVRSRATFAYICFLGLWAAAVYGQLITHGFFTWDFFKFYQCGLMALSPDRFHIYDPIVQMRWYNHVIAPLRVDLVAFNQYVPQCFLLMIPLTIFSPSLSFYVWIGVSFSFGMAGCYFLMRRLGCSAAKLPLAIIALAVLASYPAFQWFELGQSTWWLIGLVAFYFFALLSGKDKLGAFMLAVAAIKPQYVLFWIMPALALCRFRLLFWALGIELALLVMTACLVGYSNVVFYPWVVAHAETSAKVFGVWQENMICLRGVLVRLVGAESILPLTVAGMLLAAFSLWRACREAVAEGSLTSWRWMLATTILTALMFAPHVHVYDAQLVAICAATTLPLDTSQASALRGGWAYKLWWVLMVCYPAMSWVIFLALNHPGVGSQTYPVLIEAVNAILLSLSIYLIYTATRPGSR